MLITCCKMRINVTQIKVERTMYYFNNIYIYIYIYIYRERERERERERGEKEIKEEKC